MAHALHWCSDMRMAARTVEVGVGRAHVTCSTRPGHGRTRHRARSGPKVDEVSVALALPFRSVELQAHGGMALVYRAYDPSLRRSVAVKVLRPSLARHEAVVAGFLAERTVGSRVRHPGIVAVHDAGEVHGVPYLVMDWCDGRTLGAVLDDGALSVDAAAAIGAQLAGALAAAHAVGVVHCDVKPDNVMIDGETVRLIDFGVARQDGSAAAAAELVTGTPRYMAPEQWRGNALHASDVYALGCVLFEMVTGRPPFAGVFGDMMAAHMEEAPPRLCDVVAVMAPAFDALIDAMLAKEPAARPTLGVVEARLAALAGRIESGAALPARDVPRRAPAAPRAACA
jgi:serine/threonine protein kinase